MTKKQYINEIADRTCLPRKYKKKIIQDLLQEFDSILAQGYSEKEAMERMGEPDDIASGIYENYITSEIVSRPFIEYKSSKTILGMPLIHIVKGRRQEMIRTGRDGNQSIRGVPAAKGFIAIGRRAKGVIAIGNLSCGIISFGNISIGVISLSNIGLGLLCFGNIAIGLLIALGNLAMGAFAAGNLAIGYGAVGNSSIGKYAIGHLSFGYHHLSVNTIEMGQEIQNFISGFPSLVISFLKMGISLVQNLKWILIFLGIAIVLLLIAWVSISNWLESKKL
jgi:hypothetical protein